VALATDERLCELMASEEAHRMRAHGSVVIFPVGCEISRERA